MTTVAAVKMRYNPKLLWFDPKDQEFEQGDYILVETERGREVGLVMEAALEVSDAQIKKLKSPLKPVVRKLIDADFDHLDALDEKGREALPIFREIILQHGLDIKAVHVDYLFSGDKAIFYFASDVRVDFRELVRDLAAHFRIRVDMRQIGARDEARMVGGLAHCGEELCCKRMGCEFQPVSIRMAKEQDLPLNPAKISGACGRLMCCLRYEFEAYKDFRQRAPKKGSLVTTPLGAAKITDYDTPREIIHMRLEDGKSIAIPLAKMDCDCDDKGCPCNCRVSREVIDSCASPSILLALSAIDRDNDRLDDVFGKVAGDYEIAPSTPSRVRRRRSRDIEDETGKDSEPRLQLSDSVAGTDRRGNATLRTQEPERGEQQKQNLRAQNPQRLEHLRQDPQGQNPQGQDAQGLRGRRKRRMGRQSEGAGAQAGVYAEQSAEQESSQQAKPRPGQRSSGLRNPQKRPKLQTERKRPNDNKQRREGNAATGRDRDATGRDRDATGRDRDTAGRDRDAAGRDRDTAGAVLGRNLGESQQQSNARPRQRDNARPRRQQLQQTQQQESQRSKQQQGSQGSKTQPLQPSRRAQQQQQASQQQASQQQASQQNNPHRKKRRRTVTGESTGLTS